jgi:LacI family transcriptional regulator
MANIKDVAARAGVSVATVSHVLNNTKRTLPQTAERVHRAVRELGYVQNAVARNLVTGRSSIYGMLISDIRNPFFPEIMTAFQDQATLRDIDTVLMNTNYDVQRTRTCVDRLLALRVPGIAILTSQIDTSVIETLSAHEVAAVYIELGQAGRWMSNIVVDDAAGIDQAVDHLSDLGHKRVGFIGGTKGILVADRRRKAFLAGSERHGLEAQAVSADFRVRGGYAACAKLMAGFSPTAICTANDLMAFGAMEYAHESGVGLPSQLSIVGFDDIFFAQCTYPALTTVGQDRRKIGETAFQALWKLVNGEESSGSEYHIGTELVVRESTAPAAKQSK